MQFAPLSVSGLLEIVPRRHGDARGYFVETFRQDLFEAAVGPVAFVQDNQSMSAEAGTVRGLHFQLNPRAQGKLIRCLGGAILDVVVDIRRSSPTFGRHMSVELTGDNGHQFWVPPGFAHGFLVTSDSADFLYKTTDYYAPAHERCIAWNDPTLAIDWKLDGRQPLLSAKDAQGLPLAHAELFA